MDNISKINSTNVAETVNNVSKSSEENSEVSSSIFESLNDIDPSLINNIKEYAPFLIEELVKDVVNYENYKEREEKYGPYITQLEDVSNYIISKMCTGYICNIFNCETGTTIEDGITQRKYGDYTETTIELYDDKTYNQLSDEEKVQINKWRDDCKKITNTASAMPECPLEQTTEIWVQKTSAV